MVVKGLEIEERPGWWNVRCLKCGRIVRSNCQSKGQAVRFAHQLWNRHRCDPQDLAKMEGR